jgi:alkylation response protein AidB-like acyl-CoA dehydrogenase
MADLEKFRAETASWLDANAPQSIRGGHVSDLEGNWGGRKVTYSNPDMKVWLEVMAEKGWTSPTWPAEYGGGGLSKEEAKVLSQEMTRLQLPAPLVGFGLTMIGPTLLEYGNEEQKKQHLTDLASLQMKAVRDGDDFILNGQKVWTSYADLSDWIFCLVRTNPDVKKQAGITFILVDMETPGVSVVPTRLISGKSPFCETYFDDVRCPVANVVSKIDGGWTVAKALLGHERSMVAGVFGGGRARAKGKRSRLVELADRYLGMRDGRIADPVVRDQMAQNEMDTKSFALTTQRSADAAKAGHRPGAESSFFKIYGTELNMRRQELMVRIMGERALGWEGPGFEDDELELTRDWLRSRGNSLEGGSNEIQRNIIAKQVLGLPD